ncbi:MAG: response regulator [Atopostipes suicloacalis]|nr:response regulator [Atopostipes suicloacalis]
MHRLLLVDDEYMILKGLEKIIDWQALNVKLVGVAHNGKEALDFVEHNDVDLVITDVTMPVLNGIEFVQEARERGHEFKIIVLTGYQEFEYAQKFIRLGAVNYLLKPIDKVELKKSVSKAVDELEFEKKFYDIDKKYINQQVINWIRGEESFEQIENYLPDAFTQSVSNQHCVFYFNNPPKSIIPKLFDYFEKNATRMQCFRVEDDFYILVSIDIKNRTKEDLASLLNLSEENNMLLISQKIDDVNNMRPVHGQLTTMRETRDFYKLSISICDHETFFKNPHLPKELNAIVQSIYSREISIIKQRLQQLARILFDYNVAVYEAKTTVYTVVTQSYLVFDDLNNPDYVKSVNNITHSENFEDLKKVLTDETIPLKELSKKLLFSDTTREVIKIIQEEYPDKLKLKSIAKRIHLNTMYLGQLFKKETGKSFSEYLNDYRIDIAKNMLVESNDSITDISQAVGYENHGYFYKMFKKKNDISPRKYRNQFKNSLKDITKLNNPSTE